MLSADPRLQAVTQAICAARGLTFANEVGAGAFKRTFEVRLADGSSRALKLYRRAGLTSRTQREVEAISRCGHPGVARFDLIDTWKDGDEEYVFSLEEFLAGGTLTARLGGATMAVAELGALGRSLASAIAHIASLGLVHRDIKPDNVMFRSAGGEPVIVDFGLVRDLRQMSLTQTWLAHGPGTPFFAPAEQLNNEKTLIDWRSDQFSLGVVLAVAATGRHPYAVSGIDPVQTVERVMRRDPPSPDFIAWATAHGFAALVRMVAPWPINRFRTPELLERALEEAGGRR